MDPFERVVCPLGSSDQTTAAQRARDVAQLIASIRSRLRYVQDVLLPRAAAALERSDQHLSDSVGRELASTQLLLDSDA